MSDVATVTAAADTLGQRLKSRRKCPRCEQVKPLTAFAPAPSRSGGRASYCRPCHRADMSAYRSTPEGAEANRRSVREHRARQRLAREARETPGSR